MGKIAVVTDSAACIPPELVQQLDIHPVPFELVWDGASYRDGVDLTPTEFYRRFRTAETFPLTSQPPLGDLARLYAQLAAAHDGIVSIHVSAEMTGTLYSAQLAAEQVNSVPIRVLDSRTATMAEGFVVLAAAQWLRDQVCACFKFVEFYVTEFTPVMGAHTGPDVVGVAFYAGG